MSPVLTFALAITAGAVIGGLMGYYGQCSGGTCPLTSTWWRGSLYGAFIAIIIVLGVGRR